MPRASVTPPAAITGSFTASTICGTSAKVPACVAMSSVSSVRNMPRWPPASLPCAMTASTPRASSQRASAAVVAELRTRAPAALTRLTRPGSGRPEVEAHDLGPRLLHHVAEGGIERRAIARRHRRGGIDPELAIIGRKPLAPSRFTRVVELRRRVAEEVEIDRLLRARADFSHLLADLIGIEHGAGQRSERTRFGRLGGKLPVHGAGHGRLHDGKLDVEKLDETAIRPHICTIFRDLLPNLVTLLRE